MKTSGLVLFVSVVLSAFVVAPRILAQEPVGEGDSSSTDSQTQNFSYLAPTLSGGLAGQAGARTKDGWITLDGFYTPYKHMSGGGGSVAGEWIHPDLRIGLGGRVGLSFLSGHDGDFKIKNDTLNLDAHIPVKLSSWLIAYGGVGLQLFDMEYSYTVPGHFRYQDGKGGYYSKEGKKVTYVCDKPATVTTLYAGLRVILSDNFFVFGEYHKDSGTITMLGDYSRYGSSSMDVDMSASRAVIGAGFLF